MLASCGHLVVKSSQYSYASPTNERPVIFEKGNNVPDGLVCIGMISTSEKGLLDYSACSYVTCLEAVVNECKKMGGKYLEIVDVIPPGGSQNLNNACYFITAKVYTDKQ